MLEPKDKDIYSIFLCSNDDIGKEFIPGGINASAKELSTIYRLLIRPMAQLDLIVQAITIDGIHSIFFICDTQLAIPKDM